ncbi:coproporphyrinigen iii oxidase [Anaeramoeba flamelloides]|uniref:Coproporphyrinigen iii oxidase n=1 Tax=Anaeramoeba flamelloides TaxID=1746091 RepID=A0AAV8A2A2_9EUKA|nr:coproporphyrinigen iii oxidase [Anaeramoeba flamelloides]|eukprot:Anaeramoba_flamelloidesa329100_146.p1 GENE.a329100_146~~a329100_146.p1  ORF type:complete len:446 (-),score=87.89 a329100_146:76-1413(-)
MLKTLENKIKKGVFFPEVYVYPTPRLYKPLRKLKLKSLDFGEDLNLYIHVPFCKKICSYCGYVKMIDQEKIRNRYVDCLIKEIEVVGRSVKGQSKKVNSLHFGGGTPSLLSLSQIRSLMGAMGKAFPHIKDPKNQGCEVSIETTPEMIDETLVSNLLEIGFNRVSCGVQSLLESELSLANRKTNVDDITKSIYKLHKVGVPNIVLDLMVGIAGQSEESFKQTVLQTIELHPDTVEVYALGAMPNTKWKDQLQTFMNTKKLYNCYQIAMDLFLENGYIQDCHNRYALPGRGSFLQEDNTFDGQALIGFGAGARTYSKTFHYRNSYSTVDHRGAILRYIEKMENDQSPIESGLSLSREEQIRQYTIYNIESLNLSDFQNRFGITFASFFDSALSDLCQLNLGSFVNKNTFALTKKGLIYRDLIAHQFYSPQVNKVENQYRPIMEEYK